LGSGAPIADPILKRAARWLRKEHADVDREEEVPAPSHPVRSANCFG
jgi:hypothetical protein